MSSISSEELTELTALLRTPPHKRQLREVQRISKLLYWVRLFEDYEESVKEACCKYMRSAEYNPEEFVFRSGQPGETFCIVLQGKVGVMLPAATMPTSNKSNKKPFSRQRELSYAKRNLAVALLRRASVSIPRENEEVEVTELGPGASFGELALLQDAPRAASILCKEKTVLAVLRKEHFNAVLKDFQGQKLNEKLVILREMPAFQGWPRLSLSKLTYYLQERHFKRSSILYREGDPANEAYIVLEGEFKLTKTCKFPLSASSPSDRSANIQLQVVIKGPREVFGEAELLKDQCRPLTCACVSTTGKLWAITKADFVRRMQSVETLSFLRRRNERDQRWIAERIGTLASLETLKIRTNALQPTSVRLLPTEITTLTSSLKRFSNATPELTPGIKTCTSSRHVTPSNHHRTASGDSVWSRASASKTESKLQVFLRKMHSRRNVYSVQSVADLRRAN